MENSLIITYTLQAIQTRILTSSLLYRKVKKKISTINTNIFVNNNIIFQCIYFIIRSVGINIYINRYVSHNNCDQKFHSINNRIKMVPSRGNTRPSEKVRPIYFIGVLKR